MPDTMDRPAIEARTRELTQECEQLGERLGELKRKPQEERSADWAADIRNTTAALLATDAQMTAHLRANVEARGPRGALSVAPVDEDREPSSMGEAVGRAHDAWKQTGHSMRQRGNLKVELRGYDPMAREHRALFDMGNTGGTGANIFAPVGQPFLPPGAVDRRRLFVRDLIPSTPTNLATVPYIREHTPRTTEELALFVAEAAAKPEVTSQFDPETAPVKKVAAWVPVTDEMAEDAPTLMGYINSRLPYMVKVREEMAILNGNTTTDANSVAGITTVTGVQATAFASDQATTIGLAIAAIEDVDGNPDGLAMYPTDYWTMVTRRTVTAGAFDNGSPYSSGGPDNIWGLPVVRTRSQPAGHFLLGDFGMGAHIFDRQEVSVEVGRINDQFIRNEQVVLAEERFALALFRPDWFTVGALA